MTMQGPKSRFLKFLGSSRTYILLVIDSIQKPSIHCAPSVHVQLHLQLLQKCNQLQSLQITITSLLVLTHELFVPGCRQSRKRRVLVVDTTTHTTMQAGAHVALTGTRGDSNKLYSSIQATITVLLFVLTLQIQSRKCCAVQYACTARVVIHY